MNEATNELMAQLIQEEIERLEEISIPVYEQIPLGHVNVAVMRAAITNARNQIAAGSYPGMSHALAELEAFQ